MLSNLAKLFRYRGLIQSLVARELKARYRGSVLGFLWSFINPLLLLGIYSFIFTTIMPNRVEGVQPYALFMLVGILSLGFTAHTFDIRELSSIGPISGAIIPAWAIFGLIITAFLIKLPAVPVHTWQRARAEHGDALVACVVSPEFDFADF